MPCQKNKKHFAITGHGKKLCIIKFPDRKQYSLVYDDGSSFNCIGTVRLPDTWDSALENIFGGLSDSQMDGQ